MRAIVALLAGSLLSACSQLFFYPDHVMVDTPEGLGLNYVPMELAATDGTVLSAWYFPAKGTPMASVLYLHGNSRNMSAYLRNFAWLPQAGFNVLALDYRGYGASEGLPSLDGVQLDVDAGMRALLSMPGVDPERVVVFGQSLGGALAIYYVAHSAYRGHVRAVIADSPFADYQLIARDKVAAVPLGKPLRWLSAYLVDNEYSPRDSVAALSPIPLLLIHGERDTVVAPYHSKLLFETAQQPKDFWSIPEAGHIQALRDRALRKKLTEFLLESLDRAQAVAPVALHRRDVSP